MLVVVVGIIPLIWHVAHLILKEQDIKTQYIIGRTFYVLAIATLYYIMIFGTQYLKAYEYILGIPACWMMANMHFELIVRWYLHNEKIKNEQGYGAAFLDCGKLIIVRIILLVICCLFKD